MIGRRREHDLRGRRRRHSGGRSTCDRRIPTQISGRVFRPDPIAVARRRHQSRRVAETGRGGRAHLRKRRATGPLTPLHDIARHPRVVGRCAPRQVDLRARALHPGGGPGVGEERREGAGVAGGEREEGALELVGRVKAHRGLRRPGVQAQDQPKRERCRGDGG